MLKRKNIALVVVLALTLSIVYCGNSNVGGGSSADVAFDPSKQSNLEVVHYNVLLNRLLVDFDLTSGSQAVTLLNQQQAVFKIPNPKYTSLFGVQYTNVINLACKQSANEALFPDGVSMKHAWETITGREMDEGAKQLESDVLAAVASRPDDEKIFALCFAVNMDAKAMFINFVD